MPRRCRTLSTTLSAVFLVALAGILSGCGGDHSSGGASATSTGKGGASSDGGDISSSYLASGDDLTGDYAVTTNGGGNDNNDDSDDSDGGTTDLVVADNGDVSGTAPDSDGGSGDLSGIVDSSGDTDVTSESVTRKVHIVGKLKRVAMGVLMGTMTETITKNGAASVTRLVVYKLTKKTAAVSSVASR